MVDHRIKAARFLATRNLDAFDLLTIPFPNKPLVIALNALL